MRSIRSHASRIVFAAAIVLALAGQSYAGLVAFTDEQRLHAGETTTWIAFVPSSDLVVDVAENWKSELLAVGCMVAFSIYLRQRGSAESKPVGTPHDWTAMESD